MHGRFVSFRWMMLDWLGVGGVHIGRFSCREYILAKMVIPPVLTHRRFYLLFLFFVFFFPRLGEKPQSISAAGGDSNPSLFSSFLATPLVSGHSHIYFSRTVTVWGRLPIGWVGRLASSQFKHPNLWPFSPTPVVK